jgi:hypothetical protein
MDHVRFQFLWELFDDQGIMGAFVDADAAPDAEAFGDVRLACFGVQHDAFLTVADRGAEGMAFCVALLGLTVVFPEHSDAHDESSQMERAGGALST